MTRPPSPSPSRSDQSHTAPGVAGSPTTSPSEALIQANARLLALRAARAGASPPPAVDTGSSPWSSSPESPPPPAHPPASLPPHLGWESTAVTALLRRRVRRAGRDRDIDRAGIGVWPGGIGPAAAGSPSKPASPTLPGDRQPKEVIKLYPSLAMGMLRKGQVACGRLWLLLRHLDTDGRGWLLLADVRDRLTGREASLRLCGRRQLRHLLQQGNGLFWRRDADRVWLKSMAKVTARLGVSRLAGRPVALPVAILTGSIGLVRAHLYASFHSSRTPDGKRAAMPISRAALTGLSGISRRTQHTYERRARVQVRRHIGVGPAKRAADRQTFSWQHGRAAFVLVDYRGRQGPAGRRYHARRLPNSYCGPHARLGRGRQRQLNRQLADLRQYGDAGNGRAGSETAPRRRYAHNGAVAGRWLGRQSASIVYWRHHGGRGCGLWYILSGGGD